MSCVGVADAARPEIKQRLLIQLADTGAVGAPDIIRTDLELRLRIDLRVFRKKQVSAVLHRIGFLCVLSDDDGAVENALRLPAKDSLVQLAAGRMRFPVI